jgi:hypothetical protein
VLRCAAQDHILKGGHFSQLNRGACHAARKLGGRHVATGNQAVPKSIEGVGGHEDLYQPAMEAGIARSSLPQASGALDVEDAHKVRMVEPVNDSGPQSPIAVLPVDVRPFQEVVALEAGIELCLTHEQIINAVHLAWSRVAGRGSHETLKAMDLASNPVAQSRLTGA